jgi:hypothetical protein
MGEQLPQLPLETLSLIASLIPPPHYPGHTEPRSRPQPPSHIVDALDPRSPPATHPTKILSFFSRSSHLLLESSRPWLWENVDVRSGRGWLSVVNALTEEVMHEEEAVIVGDVDRGRAMDVDFKPTSILQKDGLPLTPISPPLQLESLPAEDAHMQPNTVPGGSSNYPLYAQAGPYASLSAAGPSRSSGLPPRSVSYSYSPPRPSHMAMLLTPPGSRNASPSPHPVALPPPSVLKSPVTAATAKLRGRSRSPRRSINFDTEGISAVLDRSRSVSSHPPRRIPLHRSRTSLSRTRTMSDMDADEEEEEEDDELMPLSTRRVSFSREMSPPVVEEIWENVNPELLPSPGPYIRHLNFTNFKTIGSRRTQEEAVRGRFVTAGRLEGVIKVGYSLVSVADLAELPQFGHSVHD